MTMLSNESNALVVSDRDQRLQVESVEYALERRYFENFDVGRVTLTKPMPYDVKIDSRFFALEEIGYGLDIAQDLDQLNMQNVIASLQDGSHSLIFLANGDGKATRLYVGVCRFATDVSALPTEEYVTALRNALQANFPGLRTGDILRAEGFTDRVYAPLTEHSLTSAFTGIPSLKHDPAGQFVQGLERLIDGLRGERYSFMMIAEPIARPMLDEAIDRCRKLGSEIHLQASQYVTAGKGRGTSDSTGKTEGGSIGFNTGMLTALLGFSANFSDSRSRSWSTSKSENISVSRESLNKAAQDCELTLDHYVDRLQVGKSLGLWNTGIFLLADNQNAFLRGQGIVRGLYSGAQNQLEPLRAFDLTAKHSEVQDALLHFQNPAFHVKSNDQHPLGEIFQKIATPMTTQEVSILVNLPRREVPGVRLRPRADFGINPPSVENGIELGYVVYQGGLLEQSFAVTPKSLTQHIFITGITGAGKTNTCLALLRQVHARNVPFLVIEPAKTEYRALLADNELGQTIQVFTLGAEEIAPFRLNPFEFVRGFNLLTHIDFLKAVFNASFPMYASMPYILEEAVLEVYTDRGWDIASSANRFVDARHANLAPYLPTLSDLYNKIETVVLRKKYAAQLTMDITAALKARLQSLLNGGKGLMLDTQRSIPIATWLERPTVLELRYVGDDDEKAFLIALLLVLIYEHNQVRAERATDQSDIRHITLIEEAHRLLKNIPTSVSMESANPRGKAVEMFTDILAEIREYGEGFVIVDQIPSKLTPDVVKNTNLKILHRLVADDDRRFVGNAMGLDDQQREHIVRLKPGEAIVHCAGLERATLIQVTDAKDDLKARFKAEIGIPGLKTRMVEARHANRDAYRRWIGCQFCDAPCEYLRDANRPDAFARAQFSPFFIGLLFGDLPVCKKNWEGVQPALQRHLAARSGVPQVNDGEWFCHLVQLTRAEISAWCNYYGAHLPAAGIGVELQTRVAETLRAISNQDWSNAMEHIAATRKIFGARLALQPLQLRPGCARCQRRCRFGILAQHAKLLDAKSLGARIKTTFANPANRNNYALLVRTMRDVVSRNLALPAAPGELNHIGYCYLANFTARPDLLYGYQKASASEGG
jgi:hypothetical protein